jgi:PAS domain S-box-containing protein
MRNHSKSESEKRNKIDLSKKPMAGRFPALETFAVSILQSLPIGIVTFDSELRIIYANPQAEKLLKLTEHIDKSLIEGAPSSTSTAASDWTEQLRNLVKTGNLRTFDNVSYFKNGKTRLLRIVCVPLRRSKIGTIFGGGVIIEDATEEIEIQKQLVNTERLATIGKLASKVAHELNDPLDGILRYISLTSRIAERDNLDKPKEYLARCREGLMRMVQIVSELLEFSRSTPAQPVYSQIEQIIEDAIRSMEAKSESSGVRISREYASNLPLIRSGNLFQVFCNIIKNAYDAMPQSGELRIATRLAPDNTLIAEFHDTGCGLIPENTEKIFEPFFTTKERDKGTGLGLAVCKDIVERHGGHITARNAPDGGSIFTVSLPLSEGLQKLSE